MDAYYKAQLHMLRQEAGTFAQKFPALAPMLMEQGTDPDVERVLEGVAFLCGHIQQRLDHGTLELVQALLRLVFPQALLPHPSQTIMRFDMVEGFDQALHVPAGTLLLSTPVDGVSCPYATAHDMPLWPLRIETVEQSDPAEQLAIVKVGFSSPAEVQSFLQGPLVLHLGGNYATAAETLCALLTGLDHLEVRAGGKKQQLPATALTQYTFPLNDPRLPEPVRKNRQYTEILRYFFLPNQLLYVGINGLAPLLRHGSKAFVLEFHFKKNFTQLPAFSQESFVCNTVPAINVFSRSSDPIAVDHTQEEIPIAPQDADSQHLEVLDLDSVTALCQGGEEEQYIPYEQQTEHTEVRNLYTLRCRATTTPATEHLITLLYKKKDGRLDLRRRVLSASMRCCNHTLPSRLRVGDINRPSDGTPPQVRFWNILTPTPYVPRLINDSLYWQFLSHINTNVLSMASAGNLRAMLELYLPRGIGNDDMFAANHRRCESITSFSALQETRLFRGHLLHGYGLYVTLDPQGFASRGDMYLFSCTLDRFLSAYAPINTYTRLQVTLESPGETWQWTPRMGEKKLI